MALVTDIRARQRGSRRREVILDGEPFRTTSYDVIRACDLRVGTVASPDELTARLDAVEPRLARDRALRLLAYRDRSTADLRSRLLADGYPETLAADVVADLSHVALVDDERYASDAARSLTHVRGLGRSRAVRELVARGVDGQMAHDAVDGALSPEDEEEAARALARSLAVRFRAEPDRIVARLIRRGFAPRLATRLVREECDASADDDTSSELPVSDE